MAGDPPMARLRKREARGALAPAARGGENGPRHRRQGRAPLPKGYIIGHITVNDPEAYKEYVERDTPILHALGGRFVVRGGQAQGDGGRDPPAAMSSSNSRATRRRWPPITTPITREVADIRRPHRRERDPRRRGDRRGLNAPRSSSSAADPAHRRGRWPCRGQRRAACAASSGVRRWCRAGWSDPSTPSTSSALPPRRARRRCARERRASPPCHRRPRRWRKAWAERARLGQFAGLDLVADPADRAARADVAAPCPAAMGGQVMGAETGEAQGRIVLGRDRVTRVVLHELQQATAEDARGRQRVLQPVGDNCRGSSADHGWRPVAGGLDPDDGEHGRARHPDIGAGRPGRDPEGALVTQRIWSIAPKASP